MKKEVNQNFKVVLGVFHIQIIKIFILEILENEETNLEINFDTYFLHRVWVIEENGKMNFKLILISAKGWNKVVNVHHNGLNLEKL